MTSTTDLLHLTADLVAVPSVSLSEEVIANLIEAELRSVAGLVVDRVGDNVVARTDLGRSMRLLLVGHTDTVPSGGDDGPRIEGDVLWGLGACDMKGGIAVMLDLARTVTEPAVDVTYVFYAAEEIAAEHNGLAHLFRDRPDLLGGDAAILGEPTSARLEAGCQGTMRFVVTLHGSRAHTARPWMGRNAIHRLARFIEAVEGHDSRRPVIEGCEYREALNAVLVDGGVAANVIPDAVTVTLNHRFAPDRSPAEAEAAVRATLDSVLEDGDSIEVVDMAPAAPPDLDHPLLRALVGVVDRPVDAKLGWTDVARFAEHGIPAVNFGPGDPLLAHRIDERVERSDIEACHSALLELLRKGP